jgi:hypothetical protein
MSLMTYLVRLFELSEKLTLSLLPFFNTHCLNTKFQAIAEIKLRMGINAACSLQKPA